MNAERTQSVYEKWNISVVIATQIFHNGQPSHGGNRSNFEVMTSSLPKGIIVSVASLLAASSTKDILIGTTSSGISFLTVTHCLFRGVGQDMKQTYLYLWYPLFQVQCDRCDQHNFSVKGHHHYRGTCN